MEVARKKGIPELKHHLLPRTKGFVLTMTGVKGKSKWRFCKNIFLSSRLPFAATFVIFCTCHLFYANRCNLQITKFSGDNKNLDPRADNQFILFYCQISVIIIKAICFHTICFSVSSILDLTIGFTDDGAEPHFWNVVNGKPVNAQIYCRWVTVRLKFHFENKI